MKSRNVVTLKFPIENKTVLLLSDVHWDNPKCDRNLLKSYLDKAKEKNFPVLFNGDTFCLMQGAYDPRKSKKDIRPEHNQTNYFDAVVDSAIEWFAPYASLIKMIGYGNHETSVLKRNETDIVARFASGLNLKTGSSIEIGGYGGWVVFQFSGWNKKNSVKLKYHHGYGSGGPVTKGVIHFNRLSTYILGADIIWMGHTHECNEIAYAVEYLDNKYKSRQKNILMVRTATFKEEYDNGQEGWHIERGGPPKPLGGRWLQLNPYISSEKESKGTLRVSYYTHR